MSVSDNADIQDFMAVAQGDRNAFERLFRKYYKSLCDYARGFLGRKELAEDVVQDALVYFWNNRCNIDLTMFGKAYLYTSVRHGALNVLKKQMIERRHNPLLIEFMKHLQMQEYSEEEIANIEKIKDAIEKLPEQCRVVFLMNCMEGKRYKEIAEELDISVNTVKTHITKAYRLIRQGIDDKRMSMILFFMYQYLILQNKEGLQIP